MKEGRRLKHKNWKKRLKRFKLWDGLDPLLLALKIEDDGHSFRSMGGFWKLGMTLGWQQGNGDCNPAIQPQGTEFCRPPEWARKSLLEPPERNAPQRLWFSLTETCEWILSAQSLSPQRNRWSFFCRSGSDLQSCEIISLCSFKATKSVVFGYGNPYKTNTVGCCN